MLYKANVKVEAVLSMCLQQRLLYYTLCPDKVDLLDATLARDDDTNFRHVSKHLRGL